MSLSSDYRAVKRKAQAMIQGAMMLYRGESHEKMPYDGVSSEEFHTLSRLQVDQGVMAMVLHLNLAGGSLGKMDLYKLVRTYLWDEDARAAMNVIVAEKNLM
jgi:hypothetical protein